jgi:hypothetical protein
MFKMILSMFITKAEKLVVYRNVTDLDKTWLDGILQQK